MNNIILHVGTHKTGTTSIQHYCRKNQALLLEQNVLYPDYDLIGLSSTVSHHEISHAIANKSKNKSISIRDVKSYIGKIKQFDGTVLLSAESFYRHFISRNLNENIWQMKERYISVVSALFGRNTKIVFVLRNHYDFAKSLYQENVKKSRQTQTFEEFIFASDGELDYLKNITLWEKYFDNIEVVPFEALIKSNSLESNFLEVLGINTEDFTSIPRQNDSLPIELVHFKRYVNSMPLNHETIQKVSRKILSFKNFSLWDFSHKGEYDYATPEVATQFFLKYEQSNMKLKEKYPILGDINKTKDYPPIFPGLSEDVFLKMLSRFIAT